ncbi:hypothetical protein J2S90_000061 [Arthrobacter bambusae]|uniref:Uncharacterized protein n=1 Tax=Arthrobacter bambusae TaxID=1338426 RepID=A0AAW8DCH0_9MICC|nr:hypothetical protein [Arthrobacter bambusae]MDQ0128885.1 hypothetical protein [Arthrobacter bambusae]MDQ0180226.1 hypothetical protein [Arthrobacter bambusae]
MKVICTNFRCLPPVKKQSPLRPRAESAAHINLKYRYTLGRLIHFDP